MRTAFTGVFYSEGLEDQEAANVKDAAEWFGEELATKREREFSDFLISEGASKTARDCFEIYCDKVTRLSGDRLTRVWKYQISVRCIGTSDEYTASGDAREVKRTKKLSIEIRERTEQVPNEYFKVNFVEKGTGKRKSKSVPADNPEEAVCQINSQADRVISAKVALATPSNRRTLRMFGDPVWNDPGLTYAGAEDLLHMYEADDARRDPGLDDRPATPAQRHLLKAMNNSRCNDDALKLSEASSLISSSFEKGIKPPADYVSYHDLPTKSETKAEQVETSKSKKSWWRSLLGL
jgi:hypothetical protein